MDLRAVLESKMLSVYFGSQQVLEAQLFKKSFQAKYRNPTLDSCSFGDGAKNSKKKENILQWVEMVARK